MRERALKVLLVEDNPGDALLVREALSESAPTTLRLEHADSLSAASARLERDGIDVVLLDLSLPDSAGLNGFAKLRAKAPALPIVLLTGLDDERLAAEAIARGAQDYQIKGQVTGQMLSSILRYAVQRQRLELRREEFFQHLNHELRSPLGMVYAAIESLADGMDGRLNARQRECVDIAMRSTKHIISLVDEISEFSHVNGEKLTPAARDISLPGPIEEILAEFRIPAAQHAVRLSCEIPADVPDVSCDPKHLREILINLVGNALKYTPRKGSITVSAAPLKKDPEKILLAVSDTGLGIEPQDAARIFERLYQAPKAPVHVEIRRGLGLGLYICKRLVGANSGKIWLESRPGEGSSFFFTLPAAGAAPARRSTSTKH